MRTFQYLGDELAILIDVTGEKRLVQKGDVFQMKERPRNDFIVEVKNTTPDVIEKTETVLRSKKKRKEENI